MVAYPHHLTNCLYISRENNNAKHYVYVCTHVGNILNKLPRPDSSSKLIDRETNGNAWWPFSLVRMNTMYNSELSLFYS
jgi:hypothetical protein